MACKGIEIEITCQFKIDTPQQVEGRSDTQAGGIRLERTIPETGPG
jgi:hypothetical protein